MYRDTSSVDCAPNRGISGDDVCCGVAPDTPAGVRVVLCGPSCR